MEGSFERAARNRFNALERLEGRSVSTPEKKKS